MPDAFEPMPLRTADFDYHLAPELIAQEPSAERGESRLLVVSSEFRVPGSESRTAGQSHSELGTWNSEPFTDRRFNDVLDLIPPGDLLALNTTRVRHARFRGTRPSGAAAEVLLIQPATGEHWIAMGQPGSALRPGKRVTLGPGAFIETVAVLDEGYREVRFVGLSAQAAIAQYGRLPLPPYIERAPNARDEERYQTVYAERVGSVAAPTAGLHFTAELLAQLEQKGVGIARLELEVGPGTFKPVEVVDPSAHRMHPEWLEIPEPTAVAIANLRRRGGKLWAVGTTVVRALESAGQPDGTVAPGRRETRLLITPG